MPVVPGFRCCLAVAAKHDLHSGQYGVLAGIVWMLLTGNLQDSWDRLHMTLRPITSAHGS